MNILDTVRNNIRELYDTDPSIHVNVVVKNPRRTTLSNLPVVIKGVYPHMFQIEDRSKGKPMLYSHLYTDVITKDIEIRELTCSIEQNADDRKRKHN